MHVAVGLKGKQLIHLDRARQGMNAEVGTEQVDDHQVFGPVFLRGEQFTRQGFILFGIMPPGTGALDGTGFNHTPSNGKESFRRYRYHRITTAAEKGCIRRWVGVAERVEGGPGAALIVPLKGLGQIRLIAVARLNVMSYLVYPLPKTLG